MNTTQSFWAHSHPVLVKTTDDHHPHTKSGCTAPAPKGCWLSPGRVLPHQAAGREGQGTHQQVNQGTTKVKLHRAWISKKNGVQVLVTGFSVKDMLAQIYETNSDITPKVASCLIPCSLSMAHTVKKDWQSQQLFERLFRIASIRALIECGEIKPIKRKPLKKPPIVRLSFRLPEDQAKAVQQFAKQFTQEQP